MVEDDQLIAEAMTARLEAEGFQVHVASDGLSGVELCETERPDLVVLDLMLPGLDGLEVCRRIQKDRQVPVVMLTARDEEADMLVGLALGADDYITKPFSPRELVARIHTILRRVESTLVFPGTVIRIGEDTEIDSQRRQVRKNGEDLHLTPTEFDLLFMLASKSGAVLSRQQLLNEVWGYGDPGGGRTVDSHVRSLRKKLGDDVIRTAHGVGYAIGQQVS